MYAFMETHEGGVFPRGTWPRSLSHLFMMILQTWMHWSTNATVSPEQVEVPAYLPDTEIQRRDLARHYDNIITMDREVGALLARLEADGLADDTIVVWTSDHGDGLPRAKRELFDSGTRVPLIIRWSPKYRPPGATPGTMDRRLISLVDLGPGLLAMAGLPTPSYMHGRAQVGPEPVSPRRYVYAARDRTDEAVDRQRSVRDARHRYIRNDYPGTPGAQHLAFRDLQDGMRELWELWERGDLERAQRRWFEGRPAEELYDTRTDPFELENLAGQISHRTTLQRLRLALDTWQTEVSDLGAIPEAELAERSWPGGGEPVAQAPSFERTGAGHLAVTSKTEGASIEYRNDGGRWRLYTEPIDAHAGISVAARAVRYGFAVSETRTFDSSSQ
jgi:hypothetical protein